MKKGILKRIREYDLKALKSKVKWQKSRLDLKTEIQRNSHSMFWVWEFSKKAVNICFFFYMAVQVYSMVVMIFYADLSYLGILIEQTGTILRDCVFAYLLKAGFENVGKLYWSNKERRDVEDNSDAAEG